MPDLEFQMPTCRRLKRSQLRYWTVKLWQFRWYRWLRGVEARLQARFAQVPAPKPTNVEIPMMGFRICLWEKELGGYLDTNIVIPGTNITLLMHFHCNRIVGIKIWE